MGGFLYYQITKNIMAEVIEATKTHAVILAPRLRREDIEEFIIKFIIF